MAENENDPNTPPAAPGTTTPPKVEFTQEQHDEINRIVARANAETERKAKAAERDQINAYLNEQAEQAQRAEMAEIDRLKVELEEAKAAAATANATLTEHQRRDTATTALLAAGVKAENVTHAVRLLDLSDDLTDETLTAAVEALKTSLPALFAETETPPPAPHLRPVGPSGSGTGASTPADRAKARFQAKNPQPAA
jgi:ABC-type Na+ efflux pump permease subunit